FRAGEGDVARLRMLHEDVADRGSGTGQEAESVLRNAGFVSDLDEFCSNSRRITRGLQDDGVSCDERGHGHSCSDGRGKIPRRNDDADTERYVDEVVFLALHWRDFLRSSEAQHFAAVEFQKIDGLGGVRVGFWPSFSGFVANQRVHFKFAVAKDFGGTEEALGALLG